jgi:hypothetical protein
MSQIAQASTNEIGQTRKLSKNSGVFVFVGPAFVLTALTLNEGRLTTWPPTKLKPGVPGN